MGHSQLHLRQCGDRTMMVPAVNPPDAPFEPRPYHYAVWSGIEPENGDWTDDCACPWVFHGWEGCPTILPEVPEWVGGYMVCDDCATRHTL
jgi:hypothetical protein